MAPVEAVMEQNNVTVREKRSCLMHKISGGGYTYKNNLYIIKNRYKSRTIASRYVNNGLLCCHFVALKDAIVTCITH